MDGATPHYYEQNPYANRDPRLDYTVVHDGSTKQYVAGLAADGTVNIYYDPIKKNYPTTSLVEYEHAVRYRVGNHGQRE